VCQGKRYTYQDLLEESASRARLILDKVGVSDLESRHVAYLIAPSFDHVATQWAIWRAGGCAVPMCYTHPAPELEYTMSDSEAVLCFAGPEKAELLSGVANNLGVPFELTDSVDSLVTTPQDQEGFPALDLDRRAQIIYTSGTTGRPKGVVCSWGALESQINALTTSWEWSHHDVIINPLPLHHVHGSVNVLACCLWSGAENEFIESKASALWDRIERGDGLSLFMAVPTIYHCQQGSNG